MNDFSREILDVLQVRKSKKQKSHFRARLRDFACEHGYAYREERGAFGAKNAIIGDPTSARVIFTAHYDTCPVLPVPNFITPKRIFIYLVYQLLLTVGIFAVATVVEVLLLLLLSLLGMPDAAMDAVSLPLSVLSFLSVFALLLFGPANRHTVNDNTSGVITLVEIMDALSPELRGNAAFIFFDLEEVGLFGSAGYASKHKQQMKDKLLLNFDCVSDGEHILLALQKGAIPYAEILSASYLETDACTVEICKKGIFYPSDQANFHAGVGVCALKYSKILRTHYMDRIHTPRDTVMRAENISALTDGSVRLCCAFSCQSETTEDDCHA